MRARLHVVLLGAWTLFALGCGHASPAARNAEGDRSQGFSINDKAQCEGAGMPDREVSMAAVPGAPAPNIRRVYQIVGQGAERRKVLICREVDTNLDGIKDVMRTFNDKGEALREEADTDYDGKVDSWTTFASGRITLQELDTNGDGRPDRWKHYTQGRLSRIERDTNGDGKADVWEIYNRGRLERVGVDVDGDGRVDRWDRDESGRLVPAENRPSRAEASSPAGSGSASPTDGGVPATPNADAAADKEL